MVCAIALMTIITPLLNTPFIRKYYEPNLSNLM